MAMQTGTYQKKKKRLCRLVRIVKYYFVVVVYDGVRRLQLGNIKFIRKINADLFVYPELVVSNSCSIRKCVELFLFH
jgi:hypothetical protein